MFGQNPKRLPEKGDGSILQVQEIFKTFQGEGPFTGYPSVFIRLGGCNLSCDFCDTEFESFRPIPLENLLGEVDKLAANDDAVRTHRLVVITGGEPFRQPIESLCNTLINNDYSVQIETNGTLYRPLHEKVSIICSPKTTTGTYSPIREDLLQRVTALKFIISATHPHYQSVGEVGQSAYNIPVYLQPMDEQNAEKNRKNYLATLSLAEKHGYRICLQIHKILGID